MTRVDDQGRAYAGSQLHIQIYANRRREELNRAVLDAVALSSLNAMERTRLKDAFRAIRNWQETAAYHFQTRFL